MVLLAEKPRLLWVGARPATDDVLAMLEQRWELQHCDAFPSTPARVPQADVVVLSLPQADWSDLRDLSGMLDRVDRTGGVAVVLLPRHLVEQDPLARRRGQFVLADAASPPGELVARVETASALQPAIRRLRADVVSARLLGRDGTAQAEQLDEEMRLAARIQQDFLPRRLPKVGPVSFASLYRPAGWVSGDLYDVLRLDERNVGFYVADVVGHGLPAALLTMFVKKALQTKRIDGNEYRILPPDQVLAQLNADLCQQDFTSCQFCTVFYGIIDTATLTLRYARGGHPAPLLVEPPAGSGAAAQAFRLQGEGPLLGVFPGVTFPTRDIRLARGSRLAAFSDGAEEVFPPSGGRNSTEVLAEEIRRLAHLPPEEMVLQLTARLDGFAPSTRKDDITLVVLSVDD